MAGSRVATLGNSGRVTTTTAHGRGNAAHGHRGHAHVRGRRNFALYGYPFYDSYYDAPYGYYDDGCYRLVHVRTPQGLRWQRENVCY